MCEFCSHEQSRAGGGRTDLFVTGFSLVIIAVDNNDLNAESRMISDTSL